MTDPDLLSAIAADATAAGLAAVGNDSGCAARMAAILPPALVPTYVNERGIFAAFANPADAEAVMQGLSAVAAGSPSATPPVPANPVVARAHGWLMPNNGGIDMSNGPVRAMLDQLQAAGVLTPAAVATLKGLAEVPATVSADDVSRVMLPGRPGGKVNN